MDFDGRAWVNSPLGGPGGGLLDSKTDFHINGHERGRSQRNMKVPCASGVQPPRRAALPGPSHDGKGDFHINGHERGRSQRTMKALMGTNGLGEQRKTLKTRKDTNGQVWPEKTRMACA